MDFSHSEEDDEDHLAVEQRRNIHRHYMLGSTNHLRSQCPLRKPRPNYPGRNTAPNSSMGAEWEKVDSY